VHVTGGGGEAGPASRCPEAQLSAFLRVGTTTVVGVCGTDSVSRSQVLNPATAGLDVDGACLQTKGCSMPAGPEGCSMPAGPAGRDR